MKEDTEVHPHELIAALIDGIVTPAEREAVQDHLRRCKPCRALLEDLQRLSAASASEAVPPPPSDLAARIRWRLQSLEAERQQAPSIPAYRRWLSPLPLSAAAGLALAFVALWALRGEVVPERGGVEVAVEPAPLPGAVPPPIQILSEAEAPQPAQAAAESGTPPPAQAPSQPEAPNRAQAPPKYETPPADAPPPGPAPSEPKQAQRAPETDLERVSGAPPAAESRARETLSAPSAQRAFVADAGVAASADEPQRRLDVAAGVTGPPAPARTGRRLTLERQDLRIELDEGGALSVDGDRYSCAVQLQPGEVAHLFRLASGPELGSLADLATVPEGIDPALAQRGRRVLTRTGGKAEGFQAIEYLDLPELPAPPLLRQIEIELLQIVRSGARERLEKACGPLTVP
jgi:hypothetical protein